MPLIDPVTMSGTSLQSPGQAPKPSSPIEILPNGVARIFTHIHPVLILSAYYLRFPATVANPVTSLAIGIVPLVLIQTAYCVICLPVAGSNPRALKKGKGAFVKKTSPGAIIFVSSTCLPRSLHKFPTDIVCRSRSSFLSPSRPLSRLPSS